MLCPRCGADQERCVCAPVTLEAREQEAPAEAPVEEASVDDKAALLQFLRDFGSGPPPEVPTEPPSSTVDRALPPACVQSVTTSPKAANQGRWAPPLAEERVASVPIAALAIVPLPHAHERDEEPPGPPSAGATGDQGTSGRHSGELLPSRPRRRRLLPQWKRSAMVGSSVAARALHLTPLR